MKGHYPCHIPRLRRPLVIGMLSETPMRELLRWPGMSSGPSSVWIKGMFSGAILFNAISISTRTSGSAFSFSVNDADVCCTRKRVASRFSPSPFQKEFLNRNAGMRCSSYKRRWPCQRRIASVLAIASRSRV